MLPESSHIVLKCEDSDARLEWERFDGDDCFDSFRIVVRRGEGCRRFEFGACAVNGLRRMTRFLSDPTKETESGGFRNPDIRYYDWFREGADLRLLVRFEGSQLREEFRFRRPVVEMDSTFIEAYEEKA